MPWPRTKRSKLASRRRPRESSKRKARRDVSRKRGAQPDGDDQRLGGRSRSRAPPSGGQVVPKDPFRFCGINPSRPGIVNPSSAPEAKPHTPNRGVSLMGGRRSIAARRRSLGGALGPGISSGSGRGPARDLISAVDLNAF